MKHITTSIVLLFLFIQSTQSQIIDSVYEVMNPRNRTSWNSVQSLISTEHHSCIAITDFGDIFKIDSLGHIVWEVSIPNNDFVSIRVVGTYVSTTSQPSYFYFHSWYDECDTFGESRWYKFDLDGHFIEEFINYFIPGFTLFYGGNIEFPPLPMLPKYLVSAAGKPVLYYSPDSTILIPNIDLVKVADININGEFILGTKDSIYLFKQTGGNFYLASHILHGKTGDNKYWIRWVTDSTLLLLEKNKATIFNSSLDTISVYSIPSGSKFISSRWHEPFLHLEINNFSDTQIVILNKQLDTIFETSETLLNENINDFIFYPDSVILMSGDQYYASYEGFNFIKTKDFSGTGNENFTDLSVVNWSSTDIHPEGEYGCMGYPEYESFLVDQVHIEIKNEGNVPIERAIVTSQEPYCDFYCSPQYFYRDTFMNLHLLPGETRNIYLGDIQIERAKRNVPEPLCLGVFLPDNRLDADKTNNFLCLLDPVGISTINEAQDFILYPNPTSDFIYLNWTVPKTAKWRIFNSIGAVSLTGSSEITDIRQIDVSSLPTGIYFIRCEFEKGFIPSGRFVKI